MKKILIGIIFVLFASISSRALADDNDALLKIGFTASIGVPSGAEVGVAFEPFTTWTRLEVGLTHGVANTFGGMASATFTPIKFPIMPVLQIEAGFFPTASFPSFIAAKNSLPTMGYDFVSFGPGLEFGNRDSVVFFFHPELTYLHISTGNFQNIVNNNSNNLQIGNPTANGIIMPTGRIGFAVFF